MFSAYRRKNNEFCPIQHFSNWYAGKEQSITQLTVSNSSYVLDQHSNYMFRSLEAIFRLHKIDMEEKGTIYIVCATAYQCWDLSIFTCWASVLNLITMCRGDQAGGFYVAGWTETSCVWRGAVVWRYAYNTSTWYSLFLRGFLVTIIVLPEVCLWGTGSRCVCGWWPRLLLGV